MILSAQLLDTFDRGGPRRFAFEREYESKTISPLGLLYAGVEGALLGNHDAITEITQRLDVNAGDLSPISVVRHIQAMTEVIGLALKDKFSRATKPDLITIGEHQWRSNLFQVHDALHRIILVSYLDDDTLRSFAHSWGTIGEMAALEKPITLTAVVVGNQRGGRRHSAWSKGFFHPVHKALRFAPRKRDDGFTANWTTCWREQTEIKAQTWLDQMKNDDVLDELIVSRKIQYRGDDQRMIQARADMLELIPEMEAASPDSPMRRSACDSVIHGACPYQCVCYSPTPATPEDFPGLFRRREKPLVGIGSGT